MTGKGVVVVRWLATPLAALAGAAVAQVLVFQGLSYLAFPFWGGGLGDWTWATKTVTSVFMGAAFVAIARGVAPYAKRPVALAALGVVGLWALPLISGAIGGFTWWLAAMGLAGIGGGSAALLFEQKRGVAEA